VAAYFLRETFHRHRTAPSSRAIQRHIEIPPRVAGALGVCACPPAPVGSHAAVTDIGGFGEAVLSDDAEQLKLLSIVTARHCGQYDESLALVLGE
jgi:hypothetical protein